MDVLLKDKHVFKSKVMCLEKQLCGKTEQTKTQNR
jgi:hypothetical protein